MVALSGSDAAGTRGQPLGALGMARMPAGGRAGSGGATGRAGVCHVGLRGAHLLLKKVHQSVKPPGPPHLLPAARPSMRCTASAGSKG